MKEILLHTIMHTGGTFCRNLLSASFVKQKQYRKINNNYNERFSGFKIINDTLKGLVVVKTQYDDKCKFIASHHVVPNGPIYNLIKSNKCNIPVVTTLRDPILVANTFLHRSIWNRSVPIHLVDWRRQKEIERQVEVLKECIELYNQDKTFLLLIDKKDTTKAHSMFQYCGLSITQDVYKAIESWEAINLTQKIKLSKTEKENKLRHRRLKGAIQIKNIKTIRKIAAIEFNYLRKQDDLKRSLEKLGYKNLVWF